MLSLADVASPILLSVELASCTTLILFVVATPLAWWLARSRARWKDLVAAAVAMPLVLPPTVLGFYLLIALGPNGPGGALAALWGARTLAFSFGGLLIGSIFYSLPFMVQPIRVAFELIGDEPVEVAATLGARRLQTFFYVALPMARAGLFSGGLLAFAHTMGEFGVVLMIGGNIPGKTKTLSVAIYDFVERGEWADAHVIALGLVAFSFAVVSLTMLADRRLTLRPQLA